ncbi:ComF family protein [Asticcacaulis tiandongensis]|uniref:ComF family protein n=1 Tax=Asticcacaulis tiandongensis TaxID=2565365 RepID=UPI00112BDCB4|nr:ComF family protein [Asticcacaulis tiandongensis]
MRDHLKRIPKSVKRFVSEQALLPRLRSACDQMIEVLYPRQALDTDPDVINFAAPPRTVQATGLSAGAWSSIRFLSDEGCAMCARPFEGGLYMGPDALCTFCSQTPFPFKHTRAACLYDEASRGLILAFKHADRLDLRPVLLGWLSRAGNDLLSQADIVVPVPLHPSRLFERRFNQAAELARPLARQHKRDYSADALRRIRPTHKQLSQARTAKGRMADRMANVKDAFALSEAGERRLKGRHVLLIDDVFTSGATLSACAEALLKGGVRRVDCLVLARAATQTAPL